jgi:hypothetical protein
VGDLFLGLIHYPIKNKRGDVVATAVTNLDIHDIARAAITYGVCRYFIINPMKTQRRLVERVIEHWRDGSGLEYNPDRAEALSLVSVVSDLTEAIDMISDITGKKPEIIGTSALEGKETVSFQTLRSMIDENQSPCLILFGTGWGMADQIKEQCTFMVEPIRGAGLYRHLSVRSAVAVVLDRIRG